LFSGKLKQRGIDFSSLNEGIYVYIRKATNGEIDLAKEHGHEIDAIRGLIKIYRSQKNMICPVYTNYYAGLAMDAETGTYKPYTSDMTGNIADVGSYLHLISQEQGEREELSYMMWPKVNGGYRCDPNGFFYGSVTAIDSTRKKFSATILCRRITDKITSTSRSRQNEFNIEKNINASLIDAENEEINKIGGFLLHCYFDLDLDVTDKILPLARVALSSDGKKHFNILEY
jgi:hypothetical protein